MHACVVGVLSQQWRQVVGDSLFFLFLIGTLFKYMFFVLETDTISIRFEYFLFLVNINCQAKT